MSKKVNKVAFLTAGGLAPCLSSSIGFLIDEYTKKAPDVKLIGYLDGYMGLLKGNSVEVTDEVRKDALKLLKHGGSHLAFFHFIMQQSPAIAVDMGGVHFAGAGQFHQVAE